MAKIHIIGASGSGTTTLGEALEAELSIVHLDTDDYYWKEKYSEKWTVDERTRHLHADLKKHNHWVLTGSLVNWSESFIPLFDLVVFLWIPKEIRLKRLFDRELERYGTASLPGGSRYKETCEFLEWAGLYDEGGVKVRSKMLHEQWMAMLPCPVLRIEGDYSVEQRVGKVKEYLKVKNLTTN
ncbi:MAG: AAA family ATPase [Bacillus sp. (in: Bacteria)]|nr:AAA family ATPase [Bacillus sp. (in: firmicutes)]